MKKRQGDHTFVAIGPLPPPIGGDTVSFSRLVHSQILKQANITLEIIDSSRKEKESKLVRRLDLKDAMAAVRIFAKAFHKRNQVAGILIWANNRFAYTLGLLLIMLYRFSKKKVILKLFGGDFEEEYRALPGWYRAIIRRIFGMADHILPQSSEMCRFFTERMGLASECVTHFPNFLPDEPRPIMEKSVCGPIRGIFVGQIREEKGIFRIIEALRQEHAFSCTFYGPIFDRERDRFLQEVKELPNANYGGVLSASHVIDTIVPYHFLLLPSFHRGEGYPAVIVEAFFASTPVISTNWRMIPELVQHGQNGFLVEPDAGDQIAIVVRSIQNDQTSYVNMCAAAQESARQFTAEKVLGTILLPMLLPDSSQAEPSLHVQRG